MASRDASPSSSPAVSDKPTSSEPVTTVHEMSASPCGEDTSRDTHRDKAGVTDKQVESAPVSISVNSEGAEPTWLPRRALKRSNAKANVTVQDTVHGQASTKQGSTSHPDDRAAKEEKRAATRARLEAEGLKDIWTIIAEEEEKL